LKSKLVAFMGLMEFKDWTLIGEVAVSPTGKLLAVEGSKGRMNEHYVALIDVQRWEVLRTLGVPGGMNVQSIRALRFTPDEKTLIVLSWRSIHYFSVSSGQLLRSPPVPEGTGSGNLSFSPDGKTLASTGTKSAVVLFDIEGGQSRVLVKEVGWGTARFSHDGKLLLLAGQGPGRQFSVIDVDNGTERARLIIKGGDHGSISPDGKHLVVTITTPTDRTKSELELWDLTSSKRKDTWPLNLPDTVRTHVIYAPDGRHIILSNNAGVYVLRLASPPQPIPASTAFDALDPKTIAEKDWKAIGGSDVVKKRLVGYLPLEMFREWAWIGHIEPSPNGNLLAVSGAKGKENEFVALFDVRRWEVVRTMSVPTGPSAAIQALRFTPDEEMLLVRGLHKVHFFRVATGKLERTIDIPQEVRGLNTFSHDGKTLAQINKAGEIHLLDLQTEKTRFLVKIDDVSGMMMFSRDDTLLLIGSQTNGRQFTLVEVDKARVRSSFTVKGAEWGAFHPDGRSMAFIARATAISHILEFWDTALEQRSDMWRLDLPVTSRMRVTYAPEGRHVIVNDTSAAYILRLGTP
jgi:WD40 repeat protein